MSSAKYTVHFWVARPVDFMRPTRYPKMVFTEVGGTTLLFDLELFFSKMREQLQYLMDETTVGSHVAMFRTAILSEQLFPHSVKEYQFISRLMYEKIARDEIGLNAETTYAYEGNSYVNEVLLDCVTAVSTNSEQIWVTLKPIMDDDSNFAVTVQQIRPLSWIKRKLNVQPYVIHDTTFESGDATDISGTCKRFVIGVAGKRLQVTTTGFGWLC
jgi:hypothetical protein